MKRMLAVVSVMAAIVVNSFTARAAPQPAILSLEGSRTASIDVTLKSKLTFDYTAASGSITGKGVYSGFYAEAIDKPAELRTADGSSVGLVSMRDYHGPGETAHVLNLAASFGTTLNAGRYRFYLLAQGPTSVRLPISGATSYSLHPTKSAFASAVARTDILTDPVEAFNRQPLRLEGPRSVAVASLLVGRFRAYLGLLGACINTPGFDCGQGRTTAGDSGRSLEMVSPLQDLELSWNVLYEPGVLPAGTYDAIQEATDAATLQYASGAAFALALT